MMRVKDAEPVCRHNFAILRHRTFARSPAFPRERHRDIRGSGHDGQYAPRCKQAQFPARGRARGDAEVRAPGKRVPQEGSRRARRRSPPAAGRDPSALSEVH